MISLIDIHMAEQKLRVLSEKQNILVVSTVWMGEYILITYNKVSNSLSFSGMINKEIDEEELIKLTNIIKKYIKKNLTNYI